jgi:hypothetical protein
MPSNDPEVDLEVERQSVAHTLTWYCCYLRFPAGAAAVLGRRDACQ